MLCIRGWVWCQNIIQICLAPGPDNLADGDSSAIAVRGAKPIEVSSLKESSSLYTLAFFRV